RGEKLNEKIKEIPKEDFTIVLIGKEDKEFVEDISNSWLKIHFLRKAKVRNVKQRDLKKEIEEAKLRFLLDITFKENFYLLGRKSNFISKYKFGSDIFLVYNSKFLEYLNSILSTSSNHFLVLHEPSRDILFSGKNKIAEISRSLFSKFSFKKFSSQTIELNIDKTFSKNKNHLKEKIEITISKVKKVSEKFEEILIPWSGGKDSTALLILAKISKIKFTPIFVDTGLEFKINLDYIEKISKKLKLKFEVVEANLDKVLRIKGKEFLIKRECTKQKVSSLYNFIRRNFENPLILIGDRISESLQRSFRPEFYKDEFWVFSPIKYWSFFDIQLLFKKFNLEIDPLYNFGFYRIGCKVCPFIDCLEKKIIKKFKLS
ncbi:MAG: hypothetical protein B6U78_01585, partial [Candidatus Aenigmarchaeota archaeon ex4484_224]